MKKIGVMLCLWLTCTSGFCAISNCLFGQVCSLPIDVHGTVGQVSFPIPGPYVDLIKLGQFECTFYSNDNSLQLYMTVTNVADAHAYNFPAVPNGNLMLLVPNKPTRVNVFWEQPGLPHPGIKQVQLLTQYESGSVPPQTSLSVMCLVKQR